MGTLFRRVTDNETRWDEALTKSEAVEFLVNVLRQETGIAQFNAKQGLVYGYEVEVTTEPEETTEETIDDGINSTHTDIELGDDEYKGDNGTDALDATYDNLSDDNKALVDKLLKEAMEENPELFEESPTGGNTGTTNQSPNYVHVEDPIENDTTGGANNGYVFGESGQDGIDKNATVY